MSLFRVQSTRSYIDEPCKTVPINQIHVQLSLFVQMTTQYEGSLWDEQGVHLIVDPKLAIVYLVTPQTDSCSSGVLDMVETDNVGISTQVHPWNIEQDQCT